MTKKYLKEAIDELDEGLCGLIDKINYLQKELNIIKSSNGQVNKLPRETAERVDNTIKSKLGEISKVTEANRENLNLLLEYMGLHVEQINEKCIVEDEDFYGRCECGDGEDEVCANCE